MFNFLAICIIIVCVLLVVIVLVQNSKGGGLVSSFASSNQIMGVKKTGDFLEKTTWILAAMLFILCLASAAAIPSGDEKQAVDNIGDKMQQKVEVPVTPVTPVKEKTTATDTTK